MFSKASLLIATLLTITLPTSDAIAGSSFTPSLVTTREMFDDDQTTCQTYYGSFILGGDNYPIIGMGDDLYKGAQGCNQCVLLEYKGKTAVGMLGDWAPGAGTQLDVAPMISQQLGFPVGDNPNPKDVKATFVSCGVSPSLNLGGKLRYFFGPGSKDTSFELVILGGFHPITSVTMTFGKTTVQGTRELGKFRFLTGFVLKADSTVTFTVTFDDKSVVTDTVSIATITSGLGGGGAFFKSGAVTTDRGSGVNKLNPAVLTWPDAIDGVSKQA